MKKSTTIIYLAVLLGISIASCTPCDDGDPVESSATQINQQQEINYETNS